MNDRLAVRMNLYIALLFAITSYLFFSSHSSSTAAEKRIALVIGNGDYASSVGGHLSNPEIDADLIAQALRSDGFEVVVLKNANRTTMLSALGSYALKLGEQSGDVIGFLYYSGHGMSRPGSDANFLLPVDITDMSKSDVWYDAIPLDSILRELSFRAPNATHFVVFDACRSTLRVPFKTSEKGFTRLPEIPGMFIAFSTSPQMVASDEGKDGGPYAKVLASELRAANIDHWNMFREVKQRVFDITHGTQRPWDTSDLLRSVYFNLTVASGTSTLSSSAPLNPGQIDSATNPQERLAGFNDQGPAQVPKTTTVASPSVPALDVKVPGLYARLNISGGALLNADMFDVVKREDQQNSISDDAPLSFAEDVRGACLDLPLRKAQRLTWQYLRVTNCQ